MEYFIFQKYHFLYCDAFCLEYSIFQYTAKKCCDGKKNEIVNTKKKKIKKVANDAIFSGIFLEYSIFQKKIFLL